ncbi:hypothetical protein [Celerinatantimonas sp. YJH-8]|uniref:hypothetical protein n=1 Tax=Celerinatantimonas sp. YJH-8 TaxID=3228714 RepID=UPI0038C1F2B7
MEELYTAQHQPDLNQGQMLSHPFIETNAEHGCTLLASFMDTTGESLCERVEWNKIQS